MLSHSQLQNSLVFYARKLGSTGIQWSPFGAELDRDSIGILFWLRTSTDPINTACIR